MPSEISKPLSAKSTTALPLAARTPAQRPDLSTFFIWAFCGYVLLIVLSAPLLAALTRTRGAGADATFDRLRFTAVNTATLTGFQTSLPPASFKEGGKILILLLTLLGIAFTFIVGGLAAARILRSPCTDRQVISFALASTAVLTIAGAVPFLLSDYSVVQSLTLSASAFGNSGIAVGPVPGLYDWRTHLILLPLAVLGSLGLPVLLELWDVVRLRGALSTHSRLVLSLAAAFYLIALLLFVLCQAADPASTSWRKIFASSSIAAINSRTFGLHVQFAHDWPRAMQWLVIPFMLIGGASAGTAGGLKVTTAALLARGIRQSLSTQSPAPASSPFSTRIFGFAATLVASYLALVVLFLIILLATQPQVPAERLLFETASAISNTGLSIDEITNVSAGLDITSLAMLSGRLLPLGFLCYLACRDEHSDIAIG